MATGNFEDASRTRAPSKLHSDGVMY